MDVLRCTGAGVLIETSLREGDDVGVLTLFFRRIAIILNLMTDDLNVEVYWYIDSFLMCL